MFFIFFFFYWRVKVLKFTHIIYVMKNWSEFLNKKCSKIRLRLHQRAPKTCELPGPLSGPWTPAEKDFALVMRAPRAKILFSPKNVFSSSIILFLKVTGWQLCKSYRLIGL